IKLSDEHAGEEVRSLILNFSWPRDGMTFMARPLRIEFAGAIYHVTSRGNGREAIYLDDNDRKLFVNVLGEVCVRFNWVILEKTPATRTRLKARGQICDRRLEKIR
ncbi:MAG: transposase, partial [Methylococcales bacterium]